MQITDIAEFKAGKYISQNTYASFQPAFINKLWVCSDPKINEQLGEANRLIGALDAFSSLIPDIGYFIRMHITKEATTSSKIEGTRTKFEEALISKQDLEPEKRDDWQEVDNYVNAMNFAQERLSSLPISSRLIKQTHKLLLKGARGKEKSSGEFRRSQNWIGSSLKNAHFIPPHHTTIPSLMSDLEQFIHSDLSSQSMFIPHLIKIAIIHYQFETIHPFLDGNGRIGRLLITLYLLEKGLLQKPTLYLSDFFEKNRMDYYRHLDQVRQHNDLKAWVQFFLIGIIETATHSINTFKKIIALRQSIEFEILPKLGKSQQVAQQLLNALYRNPIADAKTIAETIDLHPSNANKLVQKLIDLEMLTEITGYRRNRIFSFSPYVKIFSEE